MEDWVEEDGFGPAMDPEDIDNAAVANKNSRVVVLKHMFTLDALERDTSLLLDLKEDVRDECSSLGEVTNVVLYDVSWRLLTFSIPIFTRFHFYRKKETVL